MPSKPNGQICSIREQIIDDLVMDLKIKIERVPIGSETITRITFHGYKGGICTGIGDRVLEFNQEGEHTGSETYLIKRRTPSWLSEVKPLK